MRCFGKARDGGLPLEGSKPDRARLVGAIAAMVMALVLQPFMWRRLQKTTRLGLSTVSAIAGPVHISPWRSRIRQDAQSLTLPPTYPHS